MCYLNDKLRESEDESERGIVDVCAGILRSESGARAEEGVEWESRVYSAEDAREGMGEGLVDALREGLRSGADG